MSDEASATEHPELFDLAVDEYKRAWGFEIGTCIAIMEAGLDFQEIMAVADRRRAAENAVILASGGRVPTPGFGSRHEQVPDDGDPQHTMVEDW